MLTIQTVSLEVFDNCQCHVWKSIKMHSHASFLKMASVQVIHRSREWAVKRLKQVCLLATLIVISV
jgi:hypothetical protein